jgi:hypothetical protein
MTIKELATKKKTDIDMSDIDPDYLETRQEFDGDDNNEEAI